MNLEFLGQLILIGGAIKTFDWLAPMLKNYLADRKETRLALSQTEIDKGKLDLLAKTDVSQINRADFNAVKDAAVEMMRNAMEEKEAAKKEAEDERALRVQHGRDFQAQITVNHDRIAELQKEIGEFKSEHKSCSIVVEQLKQNLRFLYSTLNIAYWVVDTKGECTINQVFLQITGMTGKDCCNDGWIKAVHPGDRERVAYLWKNFRENFATHTSIDFRFVHIETEVVTQVTVQCSAIMKNGFEVHEYTAQTKPLPPVPNR